jgi:hypothetical protein
VKRTLVQVVLVMAAVSPSGCGTICNFAGVVPLTGDSEERPTIYGGVQLDRVWIAKEAEKPRAGSHFNWKIDLLPSFVGDTLTLPITAVVNAMRHPDQSTNPKRSAERVSYDDAPQYRTPAPLPPHEDLQPVAEGPTLPPSLSSWSLPPGR